ncbi:MAG: DNA-processing protein DprA [Tissierellia bacterium]|nr:DNA-processing protein DprA [Tissierellia bacterium]
MDKREFLIWFGSIMPPDNLVKYAMALEDIREIGDYNLEKLLSIKGVTKNFCEKFEIAKSEKYIDRLNRNIDSLNGNIITYYDDEYPEVLKLIENPPITIYYKGAFPRFDTDMIGIVGGRKCTPYGKWACEKFSRELSQLGIGIVSGLAAGIDSIAHKTALDNAAYTIGVMGCGINRIYPATNRKLYQEMEKYGTIISEFPFDYPPAAWNFPRRNRIIAALSKAVLVVEAKQRSGSLITARLAAEMGREVFAVPGNIDSLYSKGTNALIRDGAMPAIEVEDILLYFPQIFKAQIEMPLYDIPKEFEIYIELIGNSINTIDKIANETEEDIAKISAALTELELYGIVRNVSDQTFILV